MNAKTQQKLIYAGIFVVGVVLIYMWMRMTSKKSEGFEDAAGYQFVMYGVDWCPHCVKAKPEFEALGSKMTIGGADVACKVVNPEKEPEAVKPGQKIEGYPTIHLYDAQGKLVKEYSGPRTTAGFRSFLESTVRA
jgi:thiol-disulfide isomerase/thioredoxin